jgi:hypothetical protein
MIHSTPVHEPPNPYPVPPLFDSFYSLDGGTWDHVYASSIVLFREQPIELFAGMDLSEVGDQSEGLVLAYGRYHSAELGTGQ